MLGSGGYGSRKPNPNWAPAAAALTVTASFGICSLEEPFPRATDLNEKMVVAADNGLYVSKGAGRNRVSEVLLRVTGD